MRSSSGAHLVALDQVRALAALMVIVWHFTHARGAGFPVPFDYVPAVAPLAVFDEGHTGVALFTTLSGYLFARLLEGRTIHYGAFLWNRAVRLLPLLLFVVAIVGVLVWRGRGDLPAYLRRIAEGIVRPTLPNGGWSITVEFHFYLALPVLLWLARRSRALPLAIVAGGIATRALVHACTGDVEVLAYGTLVGRIDQFALGIVVCQYRDAFRGRHLIAIATLATFVLAYWWFDRSGGKEGNAPPETWIILPTIEGIAYAIAIAWYETSFSPSQHVVSTFIARMGEYSYSIYLLHFFVVFKAARAVNDHVMSLSNFYVGFAWSIIFACAMMVPAHLSYRLIEAPFLKLRRGYLRDGAA